MGIGLEISELNVINSTLVCIRIQFLYAMKV